MEEGTVWMIVFLSFVGQWPFRYPFHVEFARKRGRRRRGVVGARVAYRDSRGQECVELNEINVNTERKYSSISVGDEWNVEHRFI